MFGYITKNYEWKDSMKVLVSKASPGGDEYPHSIISAPVLADKNSGLIYSLFILLLVEEP